MSFYVAIRHTSQNPRLSRWFEQALEGHNTSKVPQGAFYTSPFSDISVQTPHGIDVSMSYGLNYLCLCYFSFQRETSLFLECGWQTHTLFYREVSLCLGLKPFLFHQLSWWFFFTQVLNKKRRLAISREASLPLMLKV